MIDDRILGQHLAIVGRTGSGKTYAAKTMVERLLHQGRRVCVLDPTGVWWGLRSSADGQMAGYPVAVFGGEHADVPLSHGSGSVLAGVIAQRNLPAVVDLSDMLIGDRHRFVTDFAEALYRENRQPLYLFIDEADEFAPQNPLPETKRMLHHVDRIVRRGRVRGFRVTLITQRPAVLHKNVLTQANTLIAMRLPAPQDRKAIEAWIDGNGDKAAGRRVLESLASLQRGEGWIWSPEHDILKRYRFGTIETFDSGRTPEDGEAIAEPAKLADVDLTGLRAAFIEAEAEAEANDPKKLRARIAELEAQAKAPRELAVDTEALEREYRRGKVAGYRAAIEDVGRQLRPVDSAIDGMLESIKSLQGLLWRVKAWEKDAPADGGGSSSDRVVEKLHSPVPAMHKPAAKVHNVNLSRAERLVLTALAQYPQGRTKTQVAILTGYASTGGGFNNALSSLRSKGWISGSGDQLWVMTGGLQALGPFDPLPRGRALLEHWMGQLSKAERAALQALAEAYPRALTKEELARRAGYEANGGGFNNALSRLRTLELIGGRGELRASEDLF